jgi:hypothetical protein
MAGWNSCCNYASPQPFIPVTPDIVVSNNTTSAYQLIVPIPGYGSNNGFLIPNNSGVYSHSINMERVTTMSAHRDPASYTPGTFPNEPYTTVFEYAIGSGTETQYPLIVTYQGNFTLGPNVVFSSNIDSIGKYQLATSASFPFPQPSDSSAITNNLNHTLGTVFLNNGASTPNTSAIFQNPSDIFTDVPGFGFVQLNLEGNTPVQSVYGHLSATSLIAYIPTGNFMSSVNGLTINGVEIGSGPGPWFYVFKVTTTDSLGDTEVMIYWIKTSASNPPETGSFPFV